MSATEKHSCIAFCNAGALLDPRFIFITKNTWNPKISGVFWSCWPDSNWWPHPYQEIFGAFYNIFCLFLVVFVPSNIVSRTFAKCSLRCFHACLWWNCGQPAICADRQLLLSDNGQNKSDQLFAVNRLWLGHWLTKKKRWTRPVSGYEICPKYAKILKGRLINTF